MQGYHMRKRRRRPEVRDGRMRSQRKDRFGDPTASTSTRSMDDARRRRPLGRPQEHRIHGFPVWVTISNPRGVATGVLVARQKRLQVIVTFTCT